MFKVQSFAKETPSETDAKNCILRSMLTTLVTLASVLDSDNFDCSLSGCSAEVKGGIIHRGASAELIKQTNRCMKLSQSDIVLNI